MNDILREANQSPTDFSARAPAASPDRAEPHVHKCLYERTHGQTSLDVSGNMFSPCADNGYCQCSCGMIIGEETDKKWVASQAAEPELEKLLDDLELAAAKSLLALSGAFDDKTGPELTEIAMRGLAISRSVDFHEAARSAIRSFFSSQRGAPLSPPQEDFTELEEAIHRIERDILPPDLATVLGYVTRLLRQISMYEAIVERGLKDLRPPAEREALTPEEARAVLEPPTPGWCVAERDLYYELRGSGQKKLRDLANRLSADLSETK